MNAVEIEEAVSALAEQPFDAASFPFAFLEAFGNKETTLKRLKSGNTNQSDMGGVLQRSNIHLKVCPPGEVAATLSQLRDSPATARHKVKFILATDGQEFQAESLADDEPPLVCAYADFADHFGYFLPLAGITTVKQIRENAFDIKATGRLNRLYVELLKTNADWDTAARREDLNHFFARLIFCFFAEDTNIFVGGRLFTDTIAQMTESSGANTHEVLAEIFRAMNIRHEERRGLTPPLRNWADIFPYVNGNLFSGSTDTPRFSKIARSYLLHVGNLDWTKINPDIFGSMIQAVADDEERGALGMHYTSVPNILKVLNPLFLDDLRAKLEEAGDNGRKLLNLRNRLARIRVFDPACGSGNFLVIAYKEMRAIEAEINRRLQSGGVHPRRLPSSGVHPRRNPHGGDKPRRSEIPLTNFRGIEIRHFASEIARLALIIAEFQCDVLYLGPRLALAEFLPLDTGNWITCGNALRLDWLSICPPTGTGVKLRADDLFSTPLEQAEIDFENTGGETYICGNPPYKGSKWHTAEQKADLAAIFDGRVKGWKSLDYVAGWFAKAATYGTRTPTITALVATNSICQGQQVPLLWPSIFATGHEIAFAHTSFKWANLASHNAGVAVVIVGLSVKPPSSRGLYLTNDEGTVVLRYAPNINAYLIAAPNVHVDATSKPSSPRADMQFGNHAYYGAALLMTLAEAAALVRHAPEAARFVRAIYGSQELISGLPRACLWIEQFDAEAAEAIPSIASRLAMVEKQRRGAKQDKAAQKLADTPYRFRDQFVARSHSLVIPRVSSESRPFLPVGLLPPNAIIEGQAFAAYDADLWNLALIASRLHLIWITTVCGKLETRFRYSNTLGWNTFPVPPLSDQNKADLTRCAEEILLAREAHFPATIADLYDPDHMDTLYPDLRAAHERNDETLERIYIGRRFKNDTERLEKLFELYTQMTATANGGDKPRPAKDGGGKPRRSKR